MVPSAYNQSTLIRRSACCLTSVGDLLCDHCKLIEGALVIGNPGFGDELAAGVLVEVDTGVSGEVHVAKEGVCPANAFPTGAHTTQGVVLNLWNRHG